MLPRSLIQITLLLLVVLLPFHSSAKRHNIRRHLKSTNDRICKDPPNLKDELATWMQISLAGDQFDDTALEEWSPSGKESDICRKSPRGDGKNSVMERALCPWENRVNFEETREPKIIAESVCLCRKSRGSSGAFCMPIVRKVPVLRRISCDMETGHWNYVRSTQMIIVGCHSVLPRTQRALRLTNVGSNSDIPN